MITDPETYIKKESSRLLLVVSDNISKLQPEKAQLAIIYLRALSTFFDYFAGGKNENDSSRVQMQVIKGGISLETVKG